MSKLEDLCAAFDHGFGGNLQIKPNSGEGGGIEDRINGREDERRQGLI
jgi:hypothetical protein